MLNIETRNAAVLPVPVWAWPATSLPSSVMGSVWAWMGVQRTKPASQMPLASGCRQIELREAGAVDGGLGVHLALQFRRSRFVRCRKGRRCRRIEGRG